MSREREDEPYYLDAREAGRRYSLSEWWFRNKQRTGELPFDQIGKYVRYRPPKLDAWFEENAVHLPARKELTRHE